MRLQAERKSYLTNAPSLLGLFWRNAAKHSYHIGAFAPETTQD
jgi:hypothetical protein